MTAELHLALYLSDAGIHAGGWRHPAADAPGDHGLDHYRRLTEAAERAKLDLVFIADKLAVDDIYGGDFATVLEHRPNTHLDPIVLLSALSSVTERIGLAATASTTYSEPFHVARMFASIDHLSGGRAAWNAVTSVSDGEARNFNRTEHLDHGTRYERAAEFLTAVRALWDTWDDGAVLADQRAGRFADAGKVRYADHDGEWFQVRGPLTVPRPPQGRPVIVQAGASGVFQRLAAENADLVFAVAPTLERGVEFYRGFKQQVREAGRAEHEVRVLPGIMPIVGETDEHAAEIERELRSLVLPIAGLTFMSASMNHDLSRYPVDGPVPDVRDEIRGSKGRFQHVIADAVERGLTLGELGAEYAATLSFPLVAGSPVTIADELQRWREAGACDGFVLMPAYVPGGVTDFFDHVVPELQRRGLFRTEYRGRTLRDHLGVDRP
ncbi:LLM class flavin-dependent oxidoreductase [Saccharopolyspora gloriosae]|uniref:FMN-dependent oxidoreductase (Nitrilotriacetate monooxygenase family) n=1 Tax=Saccharopolyspora gloriosae TaxID=455344 RepID=A0A840NJC0_9PSEU|nr:LLM class flavin-dependent oxidoreductase [Saccharopolyspora gloriosae]MBB5069262.1 FMN-dependent oxidoreductase (nitrilotriacetate monooxygenase family) [Saccharopolyspora gloriosae]